MIVEVRFGHERTPGTLDLIAETTLRFRSKNCRTSSTDGACICIAHDDFPEWINDKYGEQVVKRTKQPEEDSTIILNF